MKKMVLSLLVFSVVSAQAAFVELKNAQEFQDLIQQSSVPVVVQFAAYWCGPCKVLSANFKSVAGEYQDSQVRLAHVDAYVNKSLSTYLMGGYPTVRTFKNGSLTEPSFVGAKSPSQLKMFIDSLLNKDGEEETLYCPIE